MDRSKQTREKFGKRLMESDIPNFTSDENSVPTNCRVSTSKNGPPVTEAMRQKFFRDNNIDAYKVVNNGKGETVGYAVFPTMSPVVDQRTFQTRSRLKGKLLKQKLVATMQDKLSKEDLKLRAAQSLKKEDCELDTKIEQLEGLDISDDNVDFSDFLNGYSSSDSDDDEKMRPKYVIHERTLWVKHGSSVATNQDMKKVFESFGTVEFAMTKTHFVCTEPAGLGVVKFEKLSEAQRCLSSTEPIYLLGLTVKVYPSHYQFDPDKYLTKRLSSNFKANFQTWKYVDLLVTNNGYKTDAQSQNMDSEHPADYLQHSNGSSKLKETLDTWKSFSSLVTNNGDETDSQSQNVDSEHPADYLQHSNGSSKLKETLDIWKSFALLVKNNGDETDAQSKKMDSEHPVDYLQHSNGSSNFKETLDTWKSFASLVKNNGDETDAQSKNMDSEHPADYLQHSNGSSDFKEFLDTWKSFDSLVTNNGDETDAQSQNMDSEHPAVYLQHSNGLDQLLNDFDLSKIHRREGQACLGLHCEHARRNGY